MKPGRRKIVVAITGASGAPYAKRCLAALRELAAKGDLELGVCASPTAVEVWALECGGDMREQIGEKIWGTRDYKGIFSPDLDGRPVQINVWYPAVTKEGMRRMRFADYVDQTSPEAFSKFNSVMKERSQQNAADSVSSDQLAALQAYEKLVNRTGGIRGQQLHFQVYDDASSPQTAVQLTNTILAAKPAVVIGSTLAPATTAMMPFFKDGPVLYALTPSAQRRYARCRCAPA